MAITLIYTRTDKWLISKDDAGWRIWQDKLYWFMTSLTFDTMLECADFLAEDFHLDATCKQYLIETVNQTTSKTFELYISKENVVKIIPLQLNILQSDGEVIDWSDWMYVFTKLENNFQLWVYLGGITEQVREISLSELQISQWKAEGNPYIKELVLDLQHVDSKVYSEAISDQRKLL